ncbi:MAG TPA: DUF4232 domain-containing protein [Candidatus Limnocylindrales bacterium]
MSDRARTARPMADVLVTMAIVAASCTGGASVSIAPSVASTPAPATPAASPSASPAPSVASATPCAASSLRARGGRQGATGQAQGTVLITNTGQHACTLEGVPTSIELVTANGTVLRTTTIPQEQSAGPPALLAPGVADAADIVIYWSNWCGTSAGPLTIRLDLGSGRGVVSAPFNGPPNGAYVPRCDQPGQPSTLQVVFPFEQP